MLRTAYRRWRSYITLLGRGGGPGVDKLTSVMNDTFDETLSLEMLNGDTGETSVDFHSVDQNRLGDHLVGWHFLEDLVISRLIANDVVVGFVFNFSFRPFFLLGGLVA